MYENIENVKEDLENSFEKFLSRIEEAKKPFFSKVTVRELRNWWKGMNIYGDNKGP
jgi:hypothetical protein